MALIMDEEELSFHNVNDTKIDNFSERAAWNMKVLLSVIYTIILITGLFGNFGVCIVIKRHRSMHTPTNIFQFNLAASNVILIICRLPLQVYKYWKPLSDPLGKELCITLDVLSEACANANVLTIAAFTVDRYICWDLPKHIMPKLSGVAIYITAIWISAICFAVAQVTQFGIDNFKENEQLVSVCAVKIHDKQNIFVISSSILFLLTMSITAVLFVLIIIKLHKCQASHPVEKSSVKSGERSNRTPRFKSGASQRRVISMLAAVALSFFLCLAPFHLQRLIAFFGDNLDQRTNTFYEVSFWAKVYIILTYVSEVLYFLSAAINPILYNIMSKNFRNAFKVMLASWCRRRDRLERTYSAMLASRRERAEARTLQRSGQPRRQRPPLTVSLQLREAPPPAQYLNRSILNEESESWQWGRQLAEASNSSTSPQSISNSSLCKLDQEQNSKELASYLYQVNREIIEDTSV